MLSRSRALFNVSLTAHVSLGMIGRMKRVGIFFPDQLYKALKELSARTGLSVSEHIRRALDEYLKRQEK